jgi:ketosteroid isomerase-like protein
MGTRATNPAVEKELLELERRYWQAMVDRDVDTAMKLTADPCIVTGAQGVAKLDRAQMERMARTEPYHIDSFDLKDTQVLLLGDDVAVVAYKVHEEITLDGKKVSLDAADASTWVKRDGQWKCALHTESVAGDPFGRDRQPRQQM